MLFFHNYEMWREDKHSYLNFRYAIWADSLILWQNPPHYY